MLALLVASAVAAPALCQTTFGASASAVSVQVPVQVIQNGEPLRNLTAADFELYDGRKKVAITGFDMLDLGAAPAATAAPAAAVNAAVPASARRHFLLLFDLSFSDPAAISRARAAAKQMLSALDPTDLVAVATYNSNQGPQLIVGFTPDRRQAATGIDSLGLPTFFAPGNDPLRLVVSALPSAAGGGLPAQGVPTTTDAQMTSELAKVGVVDSRGDRNSQLQVVRNLTASFTNLAHAMASISGRKYVVYLSEGFDSSLLVGSRAPQAAESNALSDLIADADNPLQNPDADPGGGSNQTYGDTRTQNAVESMLEEFRRADCQIESVDVGGLRAPGDQGLRHTNGRDSLTNLAKSTGGELFVNFNDLSSAMGQLLRRTSVTYVLSFQPADLAADGAYHHLKVELKKSVRGARLVHRQGYYAPSSGARQPLERVLETADSVMGTEGGALDVSVMAAPFASGSDHAYVPIVIEVPGEQLVAAHPTAKIPLEIYAYAVDSSGAVQGFLTETMGLDAAKTGDALRKSGLKFFGHLDLPPGTYALRTFVRDGASGHTALRVTQLVVPAFTSGESGLLPAFFPEAPGRWMVVRETKAQAGTVDYPFLLAGEPYIPTSRPLLTSGQPLPVVVQGYNLAAGNYRASAMVMALDGREIPGARLSMKKSEGGTSALRLSGTLQPPALEKGEYLLRVTLTDTAGKAHSSTTRFVIGG